MEKQENINTFFFLFFPFLKKKSGAIVAKKVYYQVSILHSTARYIKNASWVIPYADNEGPDHCAVWPGWVFAVQREREREIGKVHLSNRLTGAQVYVQV